jgi:streptogramin lyase
MAIKPGQTVGQYIIQDKLGEGGMGAVYKAEQPAIHRSVALKVLSANFANDPDALGRFKREVDIIAELEHPYILPVYDFGQVDDNPFIVMRFMAGGTLFQHLRNRSLSQAQLMHVLGQAAEALDYAHARGVIHRDLKPGNVLLDEAGNGYLADFGLAKTLEGTRDLTATGSILGTPAYMSPEQARGEKLDHRSDIYSFAVMVYEALAGQLPFNARSGMEYIQKHLTEAPPSILTVAPRLPRAVGEVLRGAMAKDKNQRPARAGEMMANLEAALSGAQVPAAGRPVAASTVARPVPARVGTVIPSAVPQAAPRPGNSWLLPAVALLAGGGLIVVILAAAAAVYFGSRLNAPKVFTYPVGDSPRALFYDGNSLWVADFLGSTLTKLSASGCTATAASCGQATATITVDSLPSGVTGDGASLWIASSLKSTLTRFDPAAGEAQALTPLPNVPTVLVLGDGELWTANDFGGTVTRLAFDGSVIANYPAGQSPVALALGADQVWVANRDAGILTRLDPNNDGALTPTAPLGGQPSAVAVTVDRVWAALSDTNEVVEVNPADGSVLRRTTVGGKPVALLFDGVNLWSANEDGNSITRIDLATGKALSTTPVPGGPYALAWSPCGGNCRDIWVAGEAGDTVSRVRVEGP